MFKHLWMNLVSRILLRPTALCSIELQTIKLFRFWIITHELFDAVEKIYKHRSQNSQANMCISPFFELFITTTRTTFHVGTMIKYELSYIV